MTVKNRNKTVVAAKKDISKGSYDKIRYKKTCEAHPKNIQTPKKSK